MKKFLMSIFKKRSKRSVSACPTTYEVICNTALFWHNMVLRSNGCRPDLIALVKNAFEATEAVRSYLDKTKE